MYKVTHNNQIIDVLENVIYVKCLPNSQKIISVDKNQANGIVSSSGDEIYHIIGTKNTFKDKKKSVYIIPIDKEEFEKLTTQVIEKNDLELRIKELETLVQNLQQLISKS